MLLNEMNAARRDGLQPDAAADQPALDPQVSALYGTRLEGAVSHPSSVSQARADADAVFNDKESGHIPVFRTEDLLLPSCHRILGEYLALPDEEHEIPARLYVPHEPKSAEDISGLPVMLYFHGGGFLMHNIASHDSLCRKLALSCGCLVLSVGYRLAPEHKHPACMADGLAAAFWAFQHAEAFGGDPSRLILAGDSAGASISSVVSMMLRDLRRTGRFPEPVPEIGLQVLCYGPAGCIADDDSDSVRAFGHGGYVLPRAMLDWCMEQYVPESASPLDPYLNPGRAEDLTELPRTLSVTAEFDPLRDDGEAFARRLSESGCVVTQYRAPGLMHGFLLYWEKFDRAQEVIALIAKEVRNAF